MTARGKFVLTLVVLGLAAFGVWRWYGQQQQAPAASPGVATPAAPAAGSAPAAATPGPVATPAADAGGPALKTATVETLRAPPQLEPPATYVMKDNVLDLEISEYAGYAGLIVANGGTAPNEQSYFFTKHGFKVKLGFSEEESWSPLNAGKLGASVTTVDVLAAMGRQFQVVVPAQIGFSRGADGIVVRKEIGRINDLKGRVMVTGQFTEADFFMRYLAQEAGLEVALLSGLEDRPDPERVNLVFAADAFAAADLFLEDVQAGGNRLAGCVSWEPKTSEVVAGSQGKARLLVTNKNLLVIADILVVNRGFAEQNPDKVKGLVDGLIWGNSQVREKPDAHLDTVGKAFSWNREETRAELAKVHLSNLPENLAFFSGSIDAAGSFGGIFQLAGFAYGPELAKSNVDPDRFVDLAALKGLEKAGTYAAQRVAIAPIRTGGKSPIENNPLLSKDIRFFFEPNSAALQADSTENTKSLETLKQMLDVSPGSMILLRGHVDNALVESFRKQGGETFVRQMALKAAELSKNRAQEVRKHLVERLKVDAQRIETVGRGWEEPAGPEPERNRRVEAQWFTLE